MKLNRKRIWQLVVGVGLASALIACQRQQVPTPKSAAAGEAQAEQRAASAANGRSLARLAALSYGNRSPKSAS